jgi:hypothetical protein
MKNIEEIATAVRIAVEDQLDPMGHDSDALEQVILNTICGLLPTAEDGRIERASHYLCNDDFTVAEQLALIDAQAEIDDTVMLDNVEDVTVWVKVQWSFTIEEFLHEIEH